MTHTTSLRTELNFQTAVRTDAEYADIPAQARFSISGADAKNIQLLAALVVELDLYKVERFDYRASWLEGSDADAFVEADTELETLNVSKDQFWFTAVLKHTSVEITSDRTPISALSELLAPVEIIEEPLPEATLRVLVTVSGGVASVFADEGVEAEIFDFDNFHADPVGDKGLPARFADLCERAGVPIESLAAAASPVTP